MALPLIWQWGNSVELPRILQRAATLEWFDFSPGKVFQIHGVDQVVAQGLVHYIELNFQPGDRIQQPSDGRARLGYFISHDETRDEVDAKAARVKELVRSNLFIGLYNREKRCCA